jgi:hypothetical protein
MSGDHTKYHGTAEVPKREWVGLTDDEIGNIQTRLHQIYVASAKAVNGIVPMSGSQAEGEEHMKTLYNIRRNVQ